MRKITKLIWFCHDFDCLLSIDCLIVCILCKQAPNTTQSGLLRNSIDTSLVREPSSVLRRDVDGDIPRSNAALRVVNKLRRTIRLTKRRERILNRA